MDKERTHSPGEDWLEAVPDSATPAISDEELMQKLSDLVEEEPEVTAGPAEPETSEAPEASLPGEAPAEEAAEAVASDTMFFAPLGTEASNINGDTQILPAADTLPEILLDALPANKEAHTANEEEDPLAGLDALLGEDTPTEAADVAPATDMVTAPEAALTPEELKKQRRDARRKARRARLDAEEESPKTETFWQKLWFVLRMGDGLFGIPHIMATLVWLVLVFAIGTSLGRTLWLCAADVLALGKTPHEITITIESDDELTDIAEKLHDAGLIRYPGLFLKFADLTDKGEGIVKDTSITFGSEHVYDYNALINALCFKGGSTITLEVTIPEGYSCAQIFALLEEKGVCSARALENYCAEGGHYDYWFLKEIPEEYRKHKYGLEGFLFPDTYEFYMDDEPEHVIEKFLDNFNSKFTQRMIDKFIAMLNETELDLTLYDVIIMASMVEKEKAADLEGYSIASVFYNRLRKPSHYPYLDSDATINYAIDYYNKGELITDEQINASPYHTYKSPGLPPTPIANPGLSSLDAALEPYSETAQKDEYYFFLLNRETNRHEFSKTLAEHEERERKLGYHN